MQTTETMSRRRIPAAPPGVIKRLQQRIDEVTKARPDAPATPAPMPDLPLVEDLDEQGDPRAVIADRAIRERRQPGGR